MKITKAVIPAAGLGTRVLPATKSMPKKCSDRRQTDPFSISLKRQLQPE